MLTMKPRAGESRNISSGRGEVPGWTVDVRACLKSSSSNHRLGVRTWPGSTVFLTGWPGWSSWLVHPTPALPATGEGAQPRSVLSPPACGGIKGGSWLAHTNPPTLPKMCADCEEIGGLLYRLHTITRFCSWACAKGRPSNVRRVDGGNCRGPEGWLRVGPLLLRSISPSEELNSRDCDETDAGLSLGSRAWGLSHPPDWATIRGCRATWANTTA